MEVSPEKKGKEGEKDVERGKQRRPWMKLVGYRVSLLYSAFLELLMNLFLGTLHRTCRTH